MNLAAWGTITVLILAAALTPWVASRVKLGGRLTGFVSWAAGAFAVLCTVTAGWVATGTAIGRTAVPAIVGIHPVVRIGAALLFIAAVVIVVLALVPDLWSTVPADQTAAVLGFMAPLLVPYAAWGLGSVAQTLLGVVTDVAAQVTSGIAA